jgi:hypothetical protein
MAQKRNAVELHSMALDLLSKIEGDIQHEKFHHGDNKGAQEALKRIEGEVDAALQKFLSVDPEKCAEPSN